VPTALLAVTGGVAPSACEKNAGWKLPPERRRALAECEKATARHWQIAIKGDLFPQKGRYDSTLRRAGRLLRAGPGFQSRRDGPIVAAEQPTPKEASRRARYDRKQT
jgi:hypothetical protein